MIPPDAKVIGHRAVRVGEPKPDPVVFFDAFGRAWTQREVDRVAAQLLELFHSASAWDEGVRNASMWWVADRLATLLAAYMRGEHDRA